MSGARHGRWRFAILSVVLLSITLPNLLRDRDGHARMWPAWRPMIEGAVLSLAVVAALAALVAGVTTWRRERGVDA